LKVYYNIWRKFRNIENLKKSFGKLKKDSQLSKKKTHGYKSQMKIKETHPT
jgi:hypothetical protein